MRGSVLDSYAILAFLFKEAGHEKVVTLFEKAADADKTVLIPAPTWAEVHSIIERKIGRLHWQEVRTKLLGLPIEIMAIDLGLADIAGEIKATKKISMINCFTIALAKQKKADIYTGDPQFRTIEEDTRIVWL